MNNEKPQSLKDNVIKLIQSGQVKMRPRWQFILTAGLILAGSILMTVALLYLVSFAIFVDSSSNSIKEIVSSLPWLVIILAIVFLALLEILVRKYEFAHKKPLVISTLVVVVFVLIGGFLISRTPLHRDLLDRAHEDRLPFGNEIYKRYDPDARGGNDFDDLFENR